MKLSSFFRIISLVSVLGFAALAARAEDVTAIKARMEQRLGSVDALKDKKLVGENNRGFLEAKGALAPADEKTVGEENADRREIYAALAAQTGATTDQVGRARAQKIASGSKRGVLIQAPSGDWSEKQ